MRTKMIDFKLTDIDEDEGFQYWWVNDKLHRTDGPAVLELNNDGRGYQAWYQNDKKHRIDGPAVIHSNGDKEYWINGVIRSDPYLLSLLNQNININQKID